MQRPGDHEWEKYCVWVPNLYSQGSDMTCRIGGTHPN
jgi:hypothetical protein